MMLFWDAFLDICVDKHGVVQVDSCIKLNIV